MSHATEQAAHQVSSADHYGYALMYLHTITGVCVKTTDCSKSGGKTSNGGCPRDPANVKCCVKPKCKSAGNCRWKSDCKGGSLAGDCPGPAQFSCCQSSVCIHSTPTAFLMSEVESG